MAKARDEAAWAPRPVTPAEHTARPDWFGGVQSRATHGPDRYTHLPTTDWEGVVWGWRKAEAALADRDARIQKLERALQRGEANGETPVERTQE